MLQMSATASQRALAPLLQQHEVVYTTRNRSKQEYKNVSDERNCLGVVAYHNTTNK